MRLKIHADIVNSLEAQLGGLVSRGIKDAEIDENGHLIFTLTDNTTVDLGDVTGKTAYEAAVEGGFIGTEQQFNEALGKSFDAEAYGAGTRGGEDVEAGDPAYHNNAKYYAESADASAEAAGAAKTGAETAKTAAESAKNAATAAKTAAENAQSAAETAKTGAVDAKGVAQLAAATAQGHATDAGTAAGAAQSAATAATTAKTAAESAKSAAQSAKTAAETAQSNAEAAEDAAAASAAEIEDMTVSAHLVQAGGDPTVTKTGGSGTPYNLDFGIPKGDPGEDGADGHTPVKGTDYWTVADKQDIVNDVLAALPTYYGEVE